MFNIDMFKFDREKPADSQGIESLEWQYLSVEDKQCSSQALRATVPPFYHLGSIAKNSGGDIIGANRVWPVFIEDMVTAHVRMALLFGPTCVRPGFCDREIRAALIQISLEAADRTGHQTLFAIGRKSDYEPYGFDYALPHHIVLPCGTGAERVLVRCSGGFESLPNRGRLIAARHASLPDHGGPDHGGHDDEHRFAS